MEMDIKPSKLVFKAVVRNVKSNELYFHLGGNEFENIRTGKTGTVTDEIALTIFKINIDATNIINNYPMVEKLIKCLGLKYYQI